MRDVTLQLGPLMTARLALGSAGLLVFSSCTERPQARAEWDEAARDSCLSTLHLNAGPDGSDSAAAVRLAAEAIPMREDTLVTYEVLRFERREAGVVVDLAPSESPTALCYVGPGIGIHFTGGGGRVWIGNDGSVRVLERGI